MVHVTMHHICTNTNTMKEIRQLSNNIQSNQESRTVEGYAVVFESQSENLGFYEIIHRGAITEETINNSDILCKFNHNDEKVLARSKNGKGSLLLEVDEVGVRYLFEAPHTQLGDELLEHLRRGDITSSSFAFTVSSEPNSERWYKENGILYREIYKIDRLYDVSPVWNPAYSNTTCSARSQEMINKSNEIDDKMNQLIQEIELM